MHRYFNEADKGQSQSPSLIEMLRNHIERRYDNVHLQRRLVEQYIASFHPDKPFPWDLQVEVSTALNDSKAEAEKLILLASPKSVVLEHYSFTYNPELSAHQTKNFIKQLAPRLADFAFVSTRSGDVKAIHVGEGNPEALEISGQQHRAYQHPPRQNLNVPYTMKQLCGLWNTLADIPVDDENCLELSFLHFVEGESAEEIWHWFERQHPEFSVAEAGATIGPDHKFMSIP